VDEEIDGVVAPGVGAAEGVVDRKGEVGDRAPADGGVCRWAKGGPEAAEGFVEQDGGLVVVDEDAGEAGEIGEQGERRDGEDREEAHPAG